MNKNAQFQHLGFATPDFDATVEFYTNTLGFEVIHKTATPDGKTPVAFLQKGCIVYEIYEDKSLTKEAAKKIDHFCFDSSDIDADYKQALSEGRKITTNGIEELSTVFNGVRYFKIAGPSGEEIEYCQKL